MLVESEIFGVHCVLRCAECASNAWRPHDDRVKEFVANRNTSDGL